jgi:hypothetical protein
VPESPPTTVATKPLAPITLSIAPTNRFTSHPTRITDEAPTPENPPWPPDRAN